MYRQADNVTGRYTDFLRTIELEVRQTGSFKHIHVILLVFIHHFQAVDVFDPALGIFAVQDAVFTDVEAHQRAHHEGTGEQADHSQQDQRIADQARAQHMGFLPGKVVLGGIADQTFGVVHLVHDGVAGIDASGAANAFDLQTIANVDAGRTNLDTHCAVDAITQALGLVVDVLFARTAGFTTTGVVGNDQGVLVEHHTLETRIRAHVDAHLFA
ncbi:hypothetical protein D3C77_508020 [compost metagenome]